MSWLQRALSFLFVISCCHGFPLLDKEELDTIVNTFQDFLLNPNDYLESVGVREKRHTHTEDHSSYKQFPIPFIGAEVGVKYKDESDRRKGGEAYIHIADLHSLISKARSSEVRVHVLFDGGDLSTDGLFNAEVDYHLTHHDGSGTEEGKLEVVREMRNGKWHTNIKTEAHPFSGTTIIPRDISNLQLDVESDRRTTFKAKYFNGPKNRDFNIDIVRTPGKSIEAVITNKGVVSTIKGVLTKPTANEVEVTIDADIKGQKYLGKISGKMEAGKPTKVKVDFKKGQESLLHVQLEVKVAGSRGKWRGKYSIMGGKVAQGNFGGKYDNGKVEIEAGPYKLIVDLKLGESIMVQAEKGGEVMWTYSTLRENKSTSNAFIYEASSSMTLNPASQLHALIERHYPFGAFRERTNTIKVFIDKHNRNFLFPQFKFDFEVVKDGVNVVDLVADTTTSPYNFAFAAPNLFEKLEISEPSVTVTIDHVRGSHLKIDTNICGGLNFDATQAPNNEGGRSINIVGSKAGVEMFKYHGETSKVNNDAMFKVGLKSEFDLNPESIIYRMIVGRYRILTPFARRVSDMELFVDKQNKNYLLNKWYVKAKVDKDDVTVFDLDVSTVEQPYKFYMVFPAVLGKLRPGMRVVDVTVDHYPGQHLEVKVNHEGARWRGFKVARTGNGNEREIEWNGRKLGSGEYTLTDNSFTTTQTLSGGRSLTTAVTWKNCFDSEEFFKDNKINVNLDGTDVQLSLDADWAMDQMPDMDFSTPENGHFKMVATGNNPHHGDFSVSRDLTWNSANNKLTVDYSGDASFAGGFFADKSPIHTEAKFSYDNTAHDMVGKLMKVMAGKEYSITFPVGHSMPTLRIGA